MCFVTLLVINCFSVLNRVLWRHLESSLDTQKEAFLFEGVVSTPAGSLRMPGRAVRLDSKCRGSGFGGPVGGFGKGQSGGKPQRLQELNKDSPQDHQNHC